MLFWKAINKQHPNLKRSALIWLMVSVGPVHGRLVPREKYHGRGVWQRKATCFMKGGTQSRATELEKRPGPVHSSQGHNSPRHTQKCTSLIPGLFLHNQVDTIQFNCHSVQEKGKKNESTVISRVFTAHFTHCAKTQLKHWTQPMEASELWRALYSSTRGKENTVFCMSGSL